MKVHEYQAKALFAKYGVEVPGGRVAATPAEARAIAEELGGKVVVKAQIHAGGRGKGRLVAESETAAMYERLTSGPGSHEGQVMGDRVGGVRLANNAQEAEAEAANILGKHLVSIQTGPEGKLVKNVLVEEQSAVARELYLAIIIDGAQAAPLIMASTEGGQEIEVVAANDPDAIVRLPVNAASGYEPYIGRTLAARLGLAGEQAAALNKLVASLYRAAVESDASLAEINPLVVTEEGRVLALDAKFTVDDNAPLPAQRSGRTARQGRGGPPRGARRRARRFELHQARWQHWLHRQRRRPRHGDHGQHQVRPAANPPTSSTSAL